MIWFSMAQTWAKADDAAIDDRTGKALKELAHRTGKSFKQMANGSLERVLAERVLQAL